MEKIKIENLSFVYPNEDTPALSDINIEISEGEFVCICGKSGSGKSTLLRALKPMLSPEGKKSGAVYLDSQEISGLSPKEQAKNIGFVMQNPDTQIVCDKVWHELAFILENLSYPTEEIRARVAEMANFFGIQEWYYKDVLELSGGEKQLLNLAACMLTEPDIIILDEPTSQLDPIAAHDFLNTLVRVNEELGITVILSEHRLEEVFPLADRVIVMDNGKVIANGDVKTVGKILNDTKNDMLLALPTPMRIFYSFENEFDTPVTIKDAREWLQKISPNKETTFPDPPSCSNKTAIKINELWLRYEKNTPDVLKGLSLEIHENELLAIVGANGSGKSTLLSAILGINTPYRGNIKIADNKKIAALLQNPQSLFVKKTVLDDLYDALKENEGHKNANEEKLKNIIEICELKNLLKRHPYDLSGGEQQKAALAKVLLCEPDILLLDEPTKGLDTHFKISFAKILKTLQKNGVTIVMVSHDLEFCAEFSDRIAMFFDGAIISEGSPRTFFSGKRFYTTAANRMARKILPKAVLCKDIISAIGGKQYCYEESKNIYISDDKKIEITETEPDKSKKITPTKIIFGIIFAALFFMSLFQLSVMKEAGADYTNKSYIIQIMSIIFSSLFLYNIIPQKKHKNITVNTPKKKTRLRKRTLLATLIILLLIPFTIYVGIFFLGDRKYYFISLLIVLEIMLPFILLFEERRPQARELVIISVLSAIAVSGRIAFMMLPQFKPMLALIIVSGICFGGETGFLVGAVTAFVSNMYFGQGPWTPWQMFAFGIVGFLAGIFFFKNHFKSKLSVSVFGFLVTLIVHGTILNISFVITGQGAVTFDMIKSSIIMGFPLDLIHAASTAFFLWFIFEPMQEKIERIKIKYGITE